MLARDARLEDVSETAMTGFGLRVLRGGPGLLRLANLSRAAVLAGVEIALANARAVSPIQLRPIVVETLPCIERNGPCRSALIHSTSTLA